MKEFKVTELEKRACDAMHQAFCHLRYFSSTAECPRILTRLAPST